jgi:predicted Zn-dependent protease
MKVLLAVMLGLSVTGCYLETFEKGDGRYHYHVDAKFTDDQKTRIRQAFTDWENATDGTVTFEEQSATCDGDDCIEVQTATLSDLQAIEKSQGTPVSKGVLGLTSEDGTTADSNLLGNLKGELFSQTVHHELGHALGLHHETGHELMYPSSGGATQNITCLDVKQFCSVWDCQAEELSGCQEPLSL